MKFVPRIHLRGVPVRNRLIVLTLMGLLAACGDVPTEPLGPDAGPLFTVHTATGLFAWWPADGDGDDVVGDNHGTLYNGTGFTTGKFGQAFSLDGVDDFVMGTAPALPQGSAPRTLHAWVYPRVQRAAMTVFSYGTFAFNQRAALLIHNGRLYFVGEHNDVSGNQQLPVNQWSQVAITISGNQIAMYVNGALDRATTLPRGPHNTTGTTWTIGRGLRGSGNPEWYAGLIDDVAVYDRVLSLAELQTVYETGAPLGQGDDSAPLITADTAGTLGQNGWYTSDVMVTWTVEDPESTVSSTTGCDPATVDFDTGGADYTCEATSDGGTASATVTIQRDATAPQLSFSGNEVSYTVDQTVAITCAASDAVSGLATSDCPAASGDAYTFALGTNQLNATATDIAGNAASASTHFTVQVTTGSLCALVQRWVSQRGVQRALCAKLDNGAIRAFQNQVKAQSGKHVPADQAAILLRLSEAL